MSLNRIPLFFVLITSLLLLAAGDPPPTPASPETEAQLAAAFTQRLQAGAGVRPLTFDLFTPELDAAFTSPDGETAVLWLALRDDTGRLLATEPGLTLARQVDAAWQVLLPGDPGWDETLAALPDGMLPLELSPAPDTSASGPSLASTPLTGYYLPYAAGTVRWLEGSISHFQSIPELGYPSCGIDTCRYAYDFTDQNHFPLVASREGTVHSSRDWCADGSPNCTNFIVVRDTSGLTYQIYLHLAYGTIPDKLSPGTVVRRGQYLGDSDDTGYSTSQHVHFMVVNSLWQGSEGYFWGTSVDIRFADVPINNGIPRNCYEVTRFPIYDGASECLGSKTDPRNPANDWYISGNTGAYPPTATLSSPAAGVTVAGGTNRTLEVTAIAADDVRVTAVRLVAKVGSQWVEIGPKITQAAQPGLYDWDMDLCAAGPFHGPTEVALRVWDHEGNVAEALSPRTIQVDHACPPSTSQLKPAEKFESTGVRLSWDAVSGGAGFGGFELQWRTDPGTWLAANTITVPGSQRSTWFAGQPGGSYAFRLRALDINGQPEAWPAGEAYEASVANLPTSCTPDEFEPDDDRGTAEALVIGVQAERSLCGQDDLDWFQFEIGNAGTYLVRATSLKGGAAVRLWVYAADGTTVVASAEAAREGQDAALVLHPAPGRYTILAEPLMENLFGTDAVYGVMVVKAPQIFLPLMRR